MTNPSQEVIPASEPETAVADVLDRLLDTLTGTDTSANELIEASDEVRRLFWRYSKAPPPPIGDKGLGVLGFLEDAARGYVKKVGPATLDRLKTARREAQEYIARLESSRSPSTPGVAPEHICECISNSIDRCRERGYCECELGHHFWSAARRGEVMGFLEEHEPEIAAKLESLAASRSPSSPVEGTETQAISPALIDTLWNVYGLRWSGSSNAFFLEGTPRPTSPVAPPEQDFDAMLDELNRATNRVAQWRWEDTGIPSLYVLQEEKRAARESICEYVTQLEAKVVEWTGTAADYCQQAHENQARANMLSLELDALRSPSTGKEL